MAKIGRNAPCPCGSGKKYKKCCLPAEQAKTAAAAKEKQRRLEATRASRPKGPPMPEDFFIEDDEQFEEDSNRVIDLVNAGDLDEAEEACKLLEDRYPGMIDCPDRRALLCEAREEYEQAITYSERCIEIVAEHPEDYDPEFVERYERAIARLRRKIAAKATANKPADIES